MSRNGEVKKILEIGPYPPPSTGWSVRIKTLRSQLNRRGYHCVALNTNKNRRVRSAEYVDVQNFWDYIRKVSRYSMLGYRLHMHLNGKSTKSPWLTLIAQWVALMFGRRIVITFHAGARQDYFPQTGRWLIDNVFRCIFRLSGAIVCNNEEVKQAIIGYGVNREKIYPIPAFCLEYLEDKGRLPDDVELFVRERSVVLASYVYLRPEFEVDLLLDAVVELRREFPGLGLVLLGGYDESVQLAGMLEERDLTRSAYLASDVDHGVFLAIVERADVFIRTPWRDGVSSSVLEAMALGVPVIASDNGHRPEGVICYEPGNGGQLVQRLSRVLHHLEETRAVLAPPAFRDTLSEEISLLTTAS